MIEKKIFGKTGHLSTRTLFGAAALGGVDQKTADETLEVLFEWGVNHIDIAASYGNAEDRIKPWMKIHRDKFFLAKQVNAPMKGPGKKSKTRVAVWALM